MTCSFSQKTDSSGAHALVVSQPPNQETLELRFTDANTVQVSQDGQVIITMTRE